MAGVLPPAIGSLSPIDSTPLPPMISHAKSADFIPLVLVVTCLLSLSGCGPTQAKDRTRADVSGTVTLDGQPMPDGEIYFVNVAEGINEKLPIQDGKFVGQVALGTFKVEIRAYREVKANTDMYGPDAPTTRENIIPAKYNTESQLTATVSKDSSAPLEFAVTSQ